MPSVFGLVCGAVIRTRSTRTCVQLFTRTKWFGESTSAMSLTASRVTLLKLSRCGRQHPECLHGHHGSPRPSMRPPPWRVRSLTPSAVRNDGNSLCAAPLRG